MLKDINNILRFVEPIDLRNFICENKSNDTWFPDNIEYSEEEKQITLKILEIAGRLANAPQ